MASAISPYTSAGTASTPSIHCQAWMPARWLVDSPPAAWFSAQLANCETVMPSTIAICWNEASRPRYAVGATSAMYVGAITEAMPIAMPPSTRHTPSTSMLGGNIEPMPLIANSAAASSIVRTRPRWSASQPAITAPAAEPSSAIATTNAVSPLPTPKCFWMPVTAPLMTALS